MRWEQRVQFASLTDVGFRRRNNQDSHVVMLSPDAATFQIRGHLFVVADGMGGHAVGELASKIAVDTIPHSYFKNRSDDMPKALSAAIHEANAAVHEKGSQNLDFNRMGTTCVTLALGPDGAVAGHVGDSRLYRVRRDRIDQLTFDHSLEWELVRLGRMKSNEPLLPDIKHVITRSIGPEPEVEPEVEGPFPIWAGDTFLLCSDGLSGPVNDEEIGIITKHLSPTDACQLLVNLANLRGGPDNVTVVIAHVGPLPDGVSPQPGEMPTADTDDGPSDWPWLTGLSVSALTFSLGVGWAMLQELIPGVCLAALSSVAAIVLGIGWRRQIRSQTDGDPSPSKIERTAFSKAYRTAPAKLTTEFIAMLEKLQSEMLQSAATENWMFDRAAQEVVGRAAMTAVACKQLPNALKELAKSIDLLMVGLQRHRKEAAAAKEASGGNVS